MMRAKKIFLLFYGVIFITSIFYLLFTVVITLGNDNSLTDNRSVNFIALFALLLSLPGTLMQLLDLLWEKKKQYKASLHCHKCRHLIEIKLDEV